MYLFQRNYSHWGKILTFAFLISDSGHTIIIKDNFSERKFLIFKDAFKNILKLKISIYQ